MKSIDEITGDAIAAIRTAPNCCWLDSDIETIERHVRKAALNAQMQLATKVGMMRGAQRAYFQTRSQTELAIAKSREADIDQLLARILSQTP